MILNSLDRDSNLSFIGISRPKPHTSKNAFIISVWNREVTDNQLYAKQFHETCKTFVISNWDAFYSSVSFIFAVGLRMQERDYSVQTISTTGHNNIEGLDQPTLWSFWANVYFGTAICPAACCPKLLHPLRNIWHAFVHCCTSGRDLRLGPISLSITWKICDASATLLPHYATAQNLIASYDKYR